MPHRLVILAILVASALSAPLRAEDFDYNMADLPDSSAYQLMYRPMVRDDLPTTSIYSQIYDDGTDGNFSANETASGNLNTSWAQNFSIKKDFLGTAGALSTGETKEQDLSYCIGYISEVFDPVTLTMKRSCANSTPGEVDNVSENVFLGNSTDRTLKKFGDPNTFLYAVEAESKRVERQRIQERMQMLNAQGAAQKMGMVFNDQMVGMLEKFAAASPGLRDVLEEAMATGDMRLIYQRIQEAGGLDSLMSQSQLSLDKAGEQIEAEEDIEVDIPPSFTYYGH